MMYRSTRGGDSVALDAALLRGIASDGGLFVPETLPDFSIKDFADATTDIAIARRYLEPFFSGSSLASQIDDILHETFSFPLPVNELSVADGFAGLLELYHGPTAAFKDVGAGFLAACVSRLDSDAESPLLILVATSGDTGGAVAAAFDGRENVRVAVLFPFGKVSERQQLQLTCWSDNVLSLAVDGVFDDCQRMVKEAINDPELRKRFRFSSANSINIGRLLPQSIYYATTCLKHYRQTGRAPSFIVPTGNLGNALAAILARAAGLPIADIVLATNANRVIPDFLGDGSWNPQPSVETLASAMDVGNPSNMERLRKLFGEADELSGQISAQSVSDEDIRGEIAAFYNDHGEMICPHTATATFVYRNLSKVRRSEADWIMVATAHPAKFESVVEPILGETVPLPDSLASILSRPSRFQHIDASTDALVSQLDALDASGHK